jgi:hypothetical protein
MRTVVSPADHAMVHLIAKTQKMPLPLRRSSPRGSEALVGLRRSEFEGRRKCYALTLETIHGIELLITTQVQDDRMTGGEIRG